MSQNSYLVVKNCSLFRAINAEILGLTCILYLGVDIQSFWLHQESHAVGFDGHQRDERV